MYVLVFFMVCVEREVRGVAISCIIIFFFLFFFLFGYQYHVDISCIFI